MLARQAKVERRRQERIASDVAAGAPPTEGQAMDKAGLRALAAQRMGLAPMQRQLELVRPAPPQPED